MAVQKLGDRVAVNGNGVHSRMPNKRFLEYLSREPIQPCSESSITHSRKDRVNTIGSQTVPFLPIAPRGYIFIWSVEAHNNRLQSITYPEEQRP